MKLGPNFAPPPRALVVAIGAKSPGFWQRFSSALDQAVGHLDVTLVNWFRSAAHNQAVGGVVNSQHRWGTAVDLVPDPSVDRAEQIRRLKAVGFAVIDEGDHLHVQAFPTGVLQRSGIAPG